MPRSLVSMPRIVSRLCHRHTLQGIARARAAGSHARGGSTASGEARRVRCSRGKQQTFCRSAAWRDRGDLLGVCAVRRSLIDCIPGGMLAMGVPPSPCLQKSVQALSAAGPGSAWLGGRALLSVETGARRSGHHAELTCASPRCAARLKANRWSSRIVECRL